MKKSALVMIFFLLVGLPGFAMAFPNTGEYMFTVNGNDPSNPSADLYEFEQRIEAWFLDTKLETVDFDLEFYAKVDAGNTFTNEGDGDLEVGYGAENKTGSWNAGTDVAFYSVKAGNQYALYWLDGGASEGYWNTEDLFVGNGKNNPSISHISTWISTGGDQPGDPGAPVPEPSTVILLVCGISGLVALRKRG